MKKITTVILVAGKSSRFKNKTAKIFHELAGLPIIDHIFNKVKRVSDEVVFVCNEQNIKILREKFKDCKFAIQKKQKGTADAVLSAKKFINKNNSVLILFGDTPLISFITLKKLIKHYFKSNISGSMIAFIAKNPFAYGRVLLKNNKVVSVEEEINANNDIKKINLCNSGVMITSFNHLFNTIRNVRDNNIKKEKYLPDIFKISFKNNKSFNYIICNENEMLGINSLHDFNVVDNIYQKYLKNKLIDSGVTIIDPDTVRVSYDTKIAKHTILEPNVIIKTGVKIDESVIIKSFSYIENSKIGKNCSIGPFARIRPKTILDSSVKIGNYVEIKNSKIGHKSSISHFSYIGDSQLGKNVNIGAGTITCNYDGKNKNKTVIEDNVFVGSNCSLVAPLKIKKNSKIGAGSVITKDIPSNSLALERAKLVILDKIKKNS